MKLTYCLIASIFLGASLYTMIKCKDCSVFKEYERSLTPDQKAVYKEIVKERSNLYLKGLIVGSLLSGLYLCKTQGKVDPIKNSCIFVTIAMATQYAIYIFSPKSKYMLNKLHTRDQVVKWLEVYKEMKRKYHIGIILGIIGYYLISLGYLK